jgi:aspartate aminotransferase, cytoplasmic
VAGTGACRVGAVFLNKHWPKTSSECATGPFRNHQPVYVGTPTWGNYEPLFQHAGFSNFRKFDHLDGNLNLNYRATVDALRSAPDKSIFILQSVCHNPTGRDYTQQQWAEIADILLAKGHFAYLDTAYQGLGRSIEEDAWAVRHMAEKGIDMLVCQSFSKNMGLYSERVGALHVVCPTPVIATNVLDQLRSFVRWEVSSSPAYGAQLADAILHDEILEREWQNQLKEARDRLQSLRAKLYALLTTDLATPSPRTGTVEGWKHLIEENGLFSYTGLSESQTQRLIDQHHVYLPGTGRINISGLSHGNIDRVARAFDQVIRI